MPVIKKTKGALRAERLRKKFPTIDNIPEAVGPKRNKQLTEEYNMQLGKEGKRKKPKMPKTKGKSVKANQGGTSNKDPITID